MNHSSWAFSRKSTKFSAFTNSFLVAFIPTFRFYRTDFWGLWSDGQTHCETFVFRISKHYMILSVRRILEATYVMKVKLFIRSHGLKNCVMRVKWLLRNTGTLWCNQLTLSNLFSSSMRNCLSLIDHMYTFFTQFLKALIHHLGMDWLYRKRLHNGYSWRRINQESCTHDDRTDFYCVSCSVKQCISLQPIDGHRGCCKLLKDVLKISWWIGLEKM